MLRNPLKAATFQTLIGLLASTGVFSPGRLRGAVSVLRHHISKSQPAPRRTIVLKTSSRLPRVLTAGEVQAILDACGRLRDRFLFAVLYDTGMFSRGHRPSRKSGLRVCAAQRLME